MTRLSAIVSVVLLASAAALVQAADWPHWLGPNSNGISEEPLPQADWSANPPKVAWKKSVGEGYAIVSVVGNRVYTTGNAEGKDTVWCLDAESGKEIWKFSYTCEAGEHPGTRCTPTIDGSLLFTFSREGELYCLDAEKGTKKWVASVARQGAPKPMWGFADHPVVRSDRLYLTAGPIFCFKKETGELIWKSGSDKGGYSTASFFEYKGKTLLVTMVDAGILIVNADDGKEVTRMDWPTKPYRVHVVTPIIEDNKIFISSGYGMGGALLEMTDDGLKEVWRTKDMKNHTSNCILYKDALYGFDGQVNEGALTCLDWKTGKKLWSLPDIKAGGLMMADGKLLVVSAKGDLVLAEASPEKYKELGRVHVLDGPSECWTMPVLANGRVFCRNRAGDLVCLTLGGK
jgi:outer membrane protein assembly factor BamB